MEKLSAETGKEIPRLQELYDQEVELTLAAQPIWECFWDLNDRRPSVFEGFAFISYQEILAYFTLHHIPSEAWPLFLRCIKALDHAMLEKHNGKKKGESPNGSSRDHD